MKRRGHRAAPIAVMLAATFLIGRHACAFSWFQYGGIDVIWNGNQAVRYLSPTSFPEGSDTFNLFIGGMTLWTIVPAADFNYFYDPNGLDTLDPYDGYSDTIAADLDPGVLGVTYMVNNGPNWYDMDMAFSPSPNGWGWNFEPSPDCEIVTNPDLHGFSFLLVATHELGHALGLGHEPPDGSPAGTFWFIATMNPRYPGGGPLGRQNIVELHVDDRNGLRFLYPHSGPSDPPVVDLASAGYTVGPQLGKAIPLHFTPAEVLPGELLTARSVIENFGSTNQFSVRQGFYLSTDEMVDTADILLGDLRWDLAIGDGFEFDVEIPMPNDLAAGVYWLGSIIDDLDEVAETYEDNNDIVYCEPLIVNQLQPDVMPFAQEVIPCGEPYTGPTPQVTHPLNMNPMTWTLDNAPPGMSIDAQSGVISWPSPVRSEFLYTIIVRATNSGGTATQTLFLGVTEAPPEIIPISDATASCGRPYDGPTPQVTSPSCMAPIINWSLDQGPDGMTIDHNTGKVAWPEPRPATQPYTITIRATNGSGNGVESWLLWVKGGDLDADGDVDAGDFVLVDDCLAGPGTLSGSECQCADVDADGDVDLADVAGFQLAYDGPAGEGACCFADGACIDGTLLECEAAVGSYLGDGTACATASCTGACCFANGFCWDWDATTCAAAGDTTFQGFDTSCATTDCTQPTGACCHDDGSCTVDTAADCAAAAGAYQGDGSDCLNADCSTPIVGACCFPDGWQCDEVSAAACSAGGGTYEGDNTTCAAIDCPEYRNDANPATSYYNPGIGSALADDLTLAGTARDLTYYEVGVYGGANGGGTFDVTAALYTDCPGDGGQVIAGTEATWTGVPDDDYIYTLSADLSEAPVTLPDTVWLVITFSTSEAGWVNAGPAEVGETDDLFGQDDPPWGCDFAFGGTNPPYSGFWAGVQCVDVGILRQAPASIAPATTMLRTLMRNPENRTADRVRTAP